MQTSGEESRRSRLPRCGALLVGLSAVFGSLLLSSPAAALADHPVISEVLVEPSGRQSDYEFVEIYNPTGETVSIGGWTVPYKSASGTSFTTVATVPSGRVIGPYGYFLIGGGKVTPVPDYTDRSLGFAALGGHIALRNAAGLIVDKLGYGNAIDPEGAPAPAPPVGQSLERRPGASAPTMGNGQDSDDNSVDFAIRLLPEPQNSASQEVPPFHDAVLSTDTSLVTSLTQTANVTVFDVDRDNKPGVAETFSVTITSNADPLGITLAVKETALSSPSFNFQSTGRLLGFTTGPSDPEAALIQVLPSDDTVTVAYRDPAPAATQTVVFAVQAAPGPSLAAFDEREGIFSLLAYSIVYVNWQPDTSTARGYNIGAVMTDPNDSIVYWSRNCVRSHNFSFHAEAVSMQGFLTAKPQSRLPSYRVYTTLEPCPMCAGMSVLTLISRAVHGMTDPRFGGDYVSLRSAGRSTPTPVPSKLHYRDDLDRLYQQSGFTSIVSFLYSDTAKSVFQAAYNDFLTYNVQYSENAPILQQARDLLVAIQAGYPNACHP